MLHPKYHYHHHINKTGFVVERRSWERRMPRIVTLWVVSLLLLLLQIPTSTTVCVVEGNNVHINDVQLPRYTTSSSSSSSSSIRNRHHLYHHHHHHHHHHKTRIGSMVIPRGGGGGGSSSDNTNQMNTDKIFTTIPTSKWPSVLPSQNILYDTVLITLQIIATTVRTILPPIITTTKMIIDFYRILPIDLLLAQIGFIYAFAGGYYPTLFAALQAAQHCGYQNLITSLQVLIDEANTAIQACDISSIRFTSSSSSSSSYTSSSTSTPNRSQRARDIIIEKTKIVLATIDPVRINDAISAIYTTWMSISIVLEREFARTIALSITIAESIQPIISFVLYKPLQYCISTSYERWIPILIGWICKTIAMSCAWRIQRVLTAYTSAIAGGLLCARSLCRFIHKRFFLNINNNTNRFGFLNKNKKQKNKKKTVLDDSTSTENFLEKTHIDEFFGYIIAICGLYAQLGHGLSFQVPFPFTLVTWPFDIAENWIQWQITKKSSTSSSTNAV